MTDSTLLQVEQLSIHFRQYGQGLRQRELLVLHDLHLQVAAGELVAVVGASGSGKSLLAHAIMGLLPYNATMQGALHYQGAPLTAARQQALRGREIVLIPQSVNYLDPLMQIGAQLNQGRKDAASRQRTRAVLARYGLEASVEDCYPFELSGGMARRVLIASAVLAQPALVIADEPTPGLHLEAAQRVLEHLREFADGGAGVLLITHDLQLALRVADRIVVLYAGTTLEETTAANFASPQTLRHPYTRALWQAMPEHGFQPIPGSQPYALETAPRGCPFQPRCAQALVECGQDIPWRAVAGGHVRCCLSAEEAGA